MVRRARLLLKGARQQFSALKSGLGSFRLWFNYQILALGSQSIVKVSNPQRIGHLCTELDALLKDRILSGEQGRLWVIEKNTRYANYHLTKYLSGLISFRENHPALDYVSRHGDPKNVLLVTNPYAVAMYETARAFDVYARWGDRPPLASLDAEDRAGLRAYLSSVCIPDGSWYVCLHAREGGYSPEDENVHRFRNVDIRSFDCAVDEIVRRGGWCIRMGDPTMKPYPRRHGLVDYALGPHRSARLDVSLVAGCRFFLGSSSGLFSLAEVFGRPCVVTNTAPMAAAYAFAPADIAIPQLYADMSGNLLDIREILKSKAADFRVSSEFEIAGLRLLPNSAEEILDVTTEMLDRLDGTARYSQSDDRRQQAFRAQYREGHYAFGAASSIGRDFLRRHFVIEGE